MIKTIHDVVGWQFKGWDGNIYICTRWDRDHGYWMKVIEEKGEGLSDRVLNDKTCISERAIDRTFFRVNPNWRIHNESPTEHEQPCNCYVCEKRDI